MAPVVFLAFFVDIGLFASCNCWHRIVDQYQCEAALWVLAAVCVRFGAAWLFREQNTGWRYYLGVTVASPLLVHVVFRLMIPADLLRHP